MTFRALFLAVAASLGACGTDVAQTALRPSGGAPLDCRPTTEAVALPSDPALGGGDEISTSPLLGGTYAAGLGPGIALVARDGFRLYQNEELVAEGTASLDPVFVPLTFLPGDNVVSVVVASPNRAPALLVHVDELERAYVSGGSWKVSTSPSGNFRLPAYDASGWNYAHDYGLALAATGCEPPAGFVSGSTAHWIGVGDEAARTAVFRFAFRIAPIGFGATTTGGASAEPVVASDLDELVMLLASDAPAVILLPEGRMNVLKMGADVVTENACPLPCDDGSGQITYFALSDLQTCDEPTRAIPRDERHLSVTANKTLVGLGRGAIVQGLWLTIGATENVIVRNLAIHDVNPSIIEAGDGISIDGSSRVWLDHLTFRSIGDGFVDVTAGTTDLTLSWIHFDGRNEDACAGHHPRANELSAAVATIHHSFYDNVSGRAPLANRTGARVHLFNNLVSDNPDYAVGSACGAEVLLEGSYFEGVAIPTSRRECTEEATLGLIFAPEDSNAYDAVTGAHERAGMPALEPRDMVLPPMYEYPLDRASDARFTVRERAGAGSRWAQAF